MSKTTKNIISVTSDGVGSTSFGSRQIDLNGEDRWFLSEQQSALNFRLRSSAPGYKSDWHVAGDPTLLIILKGTIEIEIRNGDTYQFKVGDMFVAEDYLKAGETFNELHGHRAKVVGRDTLEALHLKLEKR